MNKDLENAMERDLDREVMEMNLTIAKILSRAWNISTYEVGKLDDLYHFYDLTPAMLDIYNSSGSGGVIKIIESFIREQGGDIGQSV